MSGTERAAFDARAAWLRELLADGLLIAAGPCLCPVYTSIAIFEAARESEAPRIVAGESRLGMLRGRDRAAPDRSAEP